VKNNKEVTELNKLLKKLNRRLLTTGSRLAQRLAAETDPAVCKAIMLADIEESFREPMEFVTTCRKGKGRAAKGHETEHG